MDDAERVEPGSLPEWAAWLTEHHTQPQGVWLVSARTADRRVFDYESAVVEALRWGWVDSTVKVLDEDRSMMWFAPRRRQSVWTRYNKQRIARLEAEGRLEAPGRAAVEAAKANGMWTVMDSVEDLVVPDDLAVAFDQHPGSREAYEGFSPSTRKQILGWIALARRPGTRAARIDKAASMAAAGQPAQG